MNALKEFIIPIKGLSNIIYRYAFHITPEFFSNFENSEIQKGIFDVDLVMDKRVGFFELTFNIKGKFSTDCDRCTASIELPISASQHLTVKMSEETVDEDSEIIFIHPDTSHFSVARYVHEFIILSMPFNRVYDCEKDNPRPCDMKVLEILEKNSVQEKKIIDPKKNPFDDLKNMFNDN